MKNLILILCLLFSACNNNSSPVPSEITIEGKKELEGLSGKIIFDWDDNKLNHIEVGSRSVYFAYRNGLLKTVKANYAGQTQRTDVKWENGKLKEIESDIYSDGFLSCNNGYIPLSGSRVIDFYGEDVGFDTLLTSFDISGHMSGYCNRGWVEIQQDRAEFTTCDIAYENVWNSYKLSEYNCETEFFSTWEGDDPGFNEIDFIDRIDVRRNEFSQLNETRRRIDTYVDNKDDASLEVISRYKWDGFLNSIEHRGDKEYTSKYEYNDDGLLSTIRNLDDTIEVSVEYNGDISDQIEIVVDDKSGLFLGLDGQERALSLNKIYLTMFGDFAFVPQF